MGKVTIQPETTRDPISLIGREAGLCWGANTEDEQKNYLRGLDCVKAQHGRTWEYPEVYMMLEGYSARVIREFYTHIGGAPTRLQESTRYVDSTQFGYIVPAKVRENILAAEIYDSTMSTIARAISDLAAFGIPREDAAMLLPLGMETKIVVRMNLRTLVAMAQQRLCTRAYWEFRQLMTDITKALAQYSLEWKKLTIDLFVPKCQANGYCSEQRSCGRAPSQADALRKIQGELNGQELVRAIAHNRPALSKDQREYIRKLLEDKSAN